MKKKYDIETLRKAWGAGKYSSVEEIRGLRSDISAFYSALDEVCRATGYFVRFFYMDSTQEEIAEGDSVKYLYYYVYRPHERPEGPRRRMTASEGEEMHLETHVVAGRRA